MRAPVEGSLTGGRAARCKRPRIADGSKSACANPDIDMPMQRYVARAQPVK